MCVNEFNKNLRDHLFFKQHLIGTISVQVIFKTLYENVTFIFFYMSVAIDLCRFEN